jgi:fimbrial chaperone protein
VPIGPSMLSILVAASTRVVISVALFLALANVSYAMSVQPLILEIEAGGKTAHGTIRVSNTSASPLPIEFQVSSLDISEKGQAISKKAPGAFTIFPPQATIGVGKSQSFRVVWMGDKALKKSETYLLGVTELPIAMGPRQSGVKIAMQFSIIVSVSPAGSAPSVEIVKTEINGAERKPIILIENKGDRHAILAMGSLEVSSGSWQKTYVGDQVREAIGGIGLIQPGKRRSFVLSEPLPPSISSYQARIRSAASR